MTELIRRQTAARNMTDDDPPKTRRDIQQKSFGVSFFLCLFGGYLGLHRFYLRDKVGGTEYAFTLGLFGVGWLWDLVHIRSMVNKTNAIISRAGCQRIVHANDADTAMRFCDNAIINTKYGESLTEILVLFLPRNLSEQFSRHMNRYFLLIAMLQLISTITPTNPWTTFGPLIIIFAVSAVREGLDDYARYQSDKGANEKQFRVSVGGEWRQVCSKEIRVGHILYLKGDEEVPCDVVLLATSEPDGTCHIQTTNLDGESDMKPRVALAETSRLSMTDLLNFRGSVECAQPNKEIYTFNSLLRTPFCTETLSLSTEQTLLQGTHLKNVDWAVGLVVYTGNETKLSQSKRQPRFKWTHSDQLINRVTIIVFCFQLLVVIVLGTAGSLLFLHDSEADWYLELPKEFAWYTSIIIPLRFLLLNSTMIPISIKVTIDLCKMLYAKFTEWDLDMWHEPTNCGVIPRNTGISEDLGQIQYVLSDKTGTLTCNEMVLKKCSIGGMLYGHNSPHHPPLHLEPTLISAISRSDPIVMQFMRCMALCNSMQAVMHEGRRCYRGSSPDEEALLMFADQLGVTLMGRNREKVHLKVGGNAEEYEQLHELPFTSERKRMSVIVREVQSQRIVMYTKGADDMIISRLSTNQPTLAKTIQHLDMAASAGLRTLMCGFRELSPTEYERWLNQMWKPATTAMEDREARRAEACEEIEKELELLGATAIQDKLQEDVPVVVKALRQAGIKIWMLTGDKMITAVQIGKQCKMISESGDDSNNLIHIDIQDPAEAEAAITNLQDALLSEKQSPTTDGFGYTVVCTGKSLTLMTEASKRIVIDCCTRAASVIMCRLTPIQKAELVRLVKETRGRHQHHQGTRHPSNDIESSDGIRRVASNSSQNSSSNESGRKHGGVRTLFHDWIMDPRPVTLAIGDGGNDVPMIQEADVGVGIVGREGLQACRASDYSMPRFRYLQQLVLVHGRYAYERSAFVAQFSFFKSWWFCWIQILYSIVSDFSGVSLFDPFGIMACNALLFIPITFYCLHRDYEQSLLLKKPSMYLQGPQTMKMNVRSIMAWWLKSLYQAFISFVIVVFAMGLAVDNDGRIFNYQELGVIMFITFIAVQCVALFIETKCYTVPQVLAIVGLFVVSLLCLAVINRVPALSSFVYYYSFFHLAIEPISYCTVLLAVACSIIPSYVWKALTAHKEHTKALERSSQRLSSVSSPKWRDTAREELLQPEDFDDA